MSLERSEVEARETLDNRPLCPECGVAGAWGVSGWQCVNEECPDWRTIYQETQPFNENLTPPLHVFGLETAGVCKIHAQAIEECGCRVLDVYERTVLALALVEYMAGPFGRGRTKQERVLALARLLRDAGSIVLVQ